MKIIECSADFAEDNGDVDFIELSHWKKIAVKINEENMPLTFEQVISRSAGQQFHYDPKFFRVQIGTVVFSDIGRGTLRKHRDFLLNIVNFI